MVLVLVLCYIYFNGYFSRLWYAIVVLFYSIRLFAKYVLFRSDSILWFAIVLIEIFIFIIAFNFFNIGIRQWPILIQIPSIASIIVYFIYKSNLHLYLHLIINIAACPLALISMGLLCIWVYIPIQILAIILAILVVNIVDKKKRKG